MSATALSQEETKLLNETLFEKLSSNDPALVKQAQDAVNDFTRIKMREDGFFRRILPQVPITNDDLDRVVETDKPTKIVDLEPESPAAISVPFATLPSGFWIRSRRYRITFDRILTPKFIKDMDELRTWIMDIRQVLTDNAIKDMLTEEDTKWITAVNTALVGVGIPVATSGVVQYEAIAGGITRESLWDSFKILPSTPANLEVNTVLINHITIKDVCKFTRDEMGGDISQDIMRNGWSYKEFMGVRWIITIKKTLVPTSTMFHFADPRFTGKHYGLVDATMYIKRESFMLEYYGYETIGASIGNTSAVSRSDFT